MIQLATIRFGSQPWFRGVNLPFVGMLFVLSSMVPTLAAEQQGKAATIALKAFPEAILVDEKREDPQAVLHSDLVKSALLNDAFGKRCRGRSLAKYFNQVNRLFITKYSTSANNYIESYIAADYRVYKADFEHLFSRALASKGGCDQAKEANWDKQMLKEFNDLFDKVEGAQWYPTIERY